jgi:hypothetical protein
MKIGPLFPQSNLSRTHRAISADSIDISSRILGGGGDYVLLVWRHGVHVLERLLLLEIWACHGAAAQHNTSISHYSPTGQRPCL